jgi:hypothetical protein
MYLLECTFLLFYTHSHFLHIPVQLNKGSHESWWWSEVVEVIGCRNAQWIIFCGPAIWICRLGLLFLGYNSVQSGSLLLTYWKQEIHSKRVNQLPSKLSNNLSTYPDRTTRNKTRRFIVSAVRAKKVCVWTQSLVFFLTDLGKYSQQDTGTLVRNMILYHKDCCKSICNRQNVVCDK